MPLEKAIIEKTYPKYAQPIVVLFNPNELRISRSNQIGEMVTPAHNGSSLQYRGGGSRSLTMDLFFDTFEQGSDVRRRTDEIYSLLLIEKTTHAPPCCSFRWGKFSFPSVVESVEGRFTLFLADGTPVRATLSVSFKEWIDPTLEARGTRLQSIDRRKIRVVRQGDTLTTIAAAEYGDPGQWRPIARANGITDPLALKPGMRLILPALTQKARIP